MSPEKIEDLGSIPEMGIRRETYNEIRLPITSGPNGENNPGASMKRVLETVKGELQLRHFGLECSSPKKFVSSQWQGDSAHSVWYMVYRWAVTFYFIGTFMYNVYSVTGQEHDEAKKRAKWYFYMTYWGYLVCTLQAFIGSIMVTRSWWERGIEDERKPRTEMTFILKLYWALHTTALDMAISITSIFWVVIYNPAHHKLDFITLDNHVLNSVVMAVDFFVVAHPTRLLHFHWPLELFMSYFIVSFVHFWMGGTQIYACLNWNKPFITSVICGSAILYLLFVHLTTWILHLLRQQVAERLQTKRNQISDEVKFAFINGSKAYCDV